MEERVLVKEYEDNGKKVIVDHKSGAVEFRSGDNLAFSCTINDIKQFTDMMYSVYIREGLNRD